MDFVMSYSCGKDSTLALHKMIEEGNKPIALLVMVNCLLYTSDFGFLRSIKITEIAKIVLMASSVRKKASHQIGILHPPFFAIFVQFF